MTPLLLSAVCTVAGGAGAQEEQVEGWSTVVVRIWWAHRPAVGPLEALVPPAERARLGRLLHQGDRERSALGVVLARAGAAEHLGVEATAVGVRRCCPRCGSDRHGPVSVRVPGRVAPQVSISHSRQVVVVAVCGPAPVGVDVEAVGSQDVDEDLLAGLVAPERLEAALRAPAPVRAAVLAGCWARAEAAAKARGTGVVLPARPDPGVGVRVVSAPGGFRAAVAVVGARPSPVAGDGRALVAAALRRARRPAGR